jgi:hypothetical protein
VEELIKASTVSEFGVPVFVHGVLIEDPKVFSIPTEELVILGTDAAGIKTVGNKDTELVPVVKELTDASVKPEFVTLEFISTDVVKSVFIYPELVCTNTVEVKYEFPSVTNDGTLANPAEVDAMEFKELPKDATVPEYIAPDVVVKYPEELGGPKLNFDPEKTLLDEVVESNKVLPDIPANERVDTTFIPPEVAEDAELVSLVKVVI